MLVGAAVYTSPRFAPLAGSFLLLPTNRQHIVSFDWRRLLMLAMGAFAFGGIYSVVTFHTIAEVDFNLRFTRLMHTLVTDTLPVLRGWWFWWCSRHSSAHF